MSQLAVVTPARCSLIFCDAPAETRGYCREHREELNEGARRERAEYVASQRRFWLKEIGLPQIFWGADFAARPTPALQRVLDYRDARGLTRGRALGLLGPTGVGKTYGAAALVNEALPYLRVSQCFVLGAQLARELGDFKTCSETMEQAARVRLLVIDDLQAPPRADSLALIEELLIRRHAEGRPLIVTSNLTRTQFEHAWGDRLVDRLRDWGEFHELPGKSLRGSCGPAS